MSRGWVVLCGWGALLVVFAAVQVVLAPKAIELALLAGAGGVVVLLGLLAVWGERRGLPPRPEGEEPRAIPWNSAASAALGAGVGVFVLGWEVGAWLMAIGGGVAVLGIGGLVREWRAVRS